jgi:flagellar motor switch protein FliN
MSESDSQSLQNLMEKWTASLAELLESMTMQRPGVRWQAVTGTDAEAAVGPAADLLWWEQAFQISPEALVWVGAPRTTWEHAAALMLKAAGLEPASGKDEGVETEARKTWQEILGQWLSMLARSVSSLLGREVLCASGAEHAPPSEPGEWAVVSMEFPDGAKTALAVTISATLCKLLIAPPPVAAPDPDIQAEPAAPTPGAKTPPTMELLLDVELPVSISFGRTELPLKEVLKLTTGSIVELNRAVNEPVEILVNHCLVARGEVVVVDGNYGVRVQRIVSRQERLRSLH